MALARIWIAQRILPRICRVTGDSAVKIRSERTFTTAATEAAPSSFKRKAGIAVFTVMIGTTFGLGTWQLSRYGWKKDVIASRQADLKNDPTDITSTSLDELMNAETNEHVYRVILQGVLEPGKVARVSPRPPPKGAPEHLIPTSGNRGALVFTPLTRPDGSKVIVLRGWWPAEIKEPEVPAGPVRIEGILRGTENPGSWGIAHRPEQHEFSWIDRKALAEFFGLDPARTAIVEAMEPIPTQRGVFPLTRQLESFAETYVMPHTHLVYSATWYTLTLFGAAIAYFRFRRGLPAGAATRAKGRSR